MKVAPAHIVIVEDDPVTRAKLAAYFKTEGYHVSEAEDGAAMRAILADRPADLLLIDIQLPDEDGLQLTRELRAQSEVGIILVTGRSDTVDRIVGLEIGADDYVTKPFSPRELTARVKAALRRLQSATGARADLSVYAFRHLRMDSGARTVSVDDQPVDLTAIEFDLLRALVENRGRVLSREQLLEKVWGADYFGEQRVVDVHLGHVRQKLGREDLIVTVRGIGYRFEDELL